MKYRVSLRNSTLEASDRHDPAKSDACIYLLPSRCKLYRANQTEVNICTPILFPWCSVYLYSCILAVMSVCCITSAYGQYCRWNARWGKNRQAGKWLTESILNHFQYQLGKLLSKVYSITGINLIILPFVGFWPDFDRTACSALSLSLSLSLWRVRVDFEYTLSFFLFSSLLYPWKETYLR